MISDFSLQLTSADFDHLIKGHLGTHFDVMDKVFPLDYLIRKAYIFDVRGLEEIGVEDIDFEKIRADMFVGFYSGTLEKYGYGTKEYHDRMPVLSHELIEKLAELGVSIIGIDFMGVRKGVEHTPADQYLSDRGVFVVENLCFTNDACGDMTIYTFPLNFAGLSGLPCRVVGVRDGI